MKTVLLVDRDRRTCRAIRSILLDRHNVLAVHTRSAALKSLKKCETEVVLVKTSSGDGDAVALLGAFRARNIRLPIVVLVGAGASGEVAKVRRLGATAVLRWPVSRRRLAEVVAAPGRTAASGLAAPLALSAEEAQSSVEELRRRFDRDMKCPVGKNAVSIRSLNDSEGATANTRVTLECPLRAEFGLVPHVFYEYIRDRCCGDPNLCPAVQIFRRRQHDDRAAPVSREENDASTAPSLLNLRV